MIRHFYALLLALLPLTITAQSNDSLPPLPQQVCIGYLSYDSAFTAMPDYAIAMQKTEELRQAYDKELKRVESDFNQKYEAFLEGQRDFPRTILLKRQNELQQLLQNNIDFKKRARAQLKNDEKETLAPLRAKLKEVIATVAKQYGLTLVVNTDSEACPFIEMDMSVDITKEVIQCLQSESSTAATAD